MFERISFVVIDVDGTMTDGSIYYDENGNELKKFNTKDAAGFFAAHEANIKIMVLTGRECLATKRRMEELRVDYIYQNIKDKYTFLKDFMNIYNLRKEDVGYIGDDLNDLRPMCLAGFVACPSDACPEVIEIADYVSKKRGGEGVIRDVFETMLRNTGDWPELVRKVYGTGI